MRVTMIATPSTAAAPESARPGHHDREQRVRPARFPEGKAVADRAIASPPTMLMKRIQNAGDASPRMNLLAPSMERRSRLPLAPRRGAHGLRPG